MLILNLLIYSAITFANNCDPHVMVEKACRYFKGQQKQLLDMSGETKIINPARFEKFIESDQNLREPSTKEIARINKLFDEVKSELIQKIENGIPYEKQSSVKKNMIDRINLVQMASPQDIQSEQRIKCITQKVGAFYNPNNSKIEVCPLFYQYPTESLYFSLAHELSHAIDPCALNHNIYQISLNQVEMAFPLDEENQKPSGMISFFIDNSDEIFILDVGKNKSKIAEIFKNQIGQKPKLSSIKKENYPYMDRFSCEKKSKKSVSVEDCSMDPHNEIMSDHFGAWVLNSLLPEKLTEPQKLSLIGGVFPDVCLTSKDRKTHGPNYLQSRKRMADVILQMPGILEKMGCSKPKENKCFKDFQSQKGLSGQPAKLQEDINQR